jgi:hypothetical protein
MSGQRSFPQSFLEPLHRAHRLPLGVEVLTESGLSKNPNDIELPSETIPYFEPRMIYMTFVRTGVKVSSCPRGNMMVRHLLIAAVFDDPDIGVGKTETVVHHSRVHSVILSRETGVDPLLSKLHRPVLTGGH